MDNISLVLNHNHITRLPYFWYGLFSWMEKMEQLIDKIFIFSNLFS